MPLILKTGAADGGERVDDAMAAVSDVDPQRLEAILPAGYGGIIAADMLKH
jgi:hypothetical protein